MNDSYDVDDAGYDVDDAVILNNAMMLMTPMTVDDAVMLQMLQATARSVFWFVGSRRQAGCMCCITEW